MTYLERPVPEPLAPAVTRVWYLEAETAARFERIFPQPAVHFILNLSGPYLLLDQGAGQVRSFPAGFLSGLQRRYLTIQSPPVIRHIGVELAPFGLARFSTLRAEALAGTVTDSQGLIGDTTALRDAVRASLAATPGEPGHAAALDLVLAHLQACARPGRVPPAGILRAWARVQTDPDEPVASIAAGAGLSHRALIDGFRTWCGVTPKVFADIVRFRQFVAALPLDGPMPPWSEFVGASGYYDQPHFIRVFRAFTGFTPSRYLEIVARYGTDYAAFVPLDTPGDETEKYTSRAADRLLP
ncbi:helix-turn-helix domain-containing protein [Cryobacterium mannosilyticum]|uniref:AraC family transcriptional regulator n=2 Tax=Cryobacterium TaxID=69578 RepID=A0A4R8WIS3_9MICO|nr:AraC family transcriptional regulator [Cryobacterium mannosilyticum]TFC07433.1 AraC family transcriptional regulator [Cryobacterium mannosilyticum]